MFQTPKNDDIYVRDHPCSPVIFPGGCLGGVGWFFSDYRVSPNFLLCWGWVVVEVGLGCDNSIKSTNSPNMTENIIFGMQKSPYSLFVYGMNKKEEKISF